MEHPKDTMQSDHDLLIKLNENVTHMREEMRVTNDSITKQVGDHEVRIRLLENGINSETGEKKAKKEFSAATKWAVGVLIAIAGVVEPILILYIAGK
jgi:hypothetical protein